MGTACEGCEPCAPTLKPTPAPTLKPTPRPTHAPPTLTPPTPAPPPKQCQGWCETNTNPWEGPNSKCTYNACDGCARCFCTTLKPDNPTWTQARCQERCGDADKCIASQSNCAKMCTEACPCGQ